ncbi:NACHT domain-containing protein [Streptomyces sp. NPDC059258]|uniref:NACHT domain-containing protein n=1 Tax=unclassified Streptomyces TaxID=2593676 RepID=UPI0036C2F7DA
MVSGVELAILASAKPVLERAAGTALGKMIPSPAGAIQSRFRNRATRKLIAEENGITQGYPEISAEFSHALIEYLDSPDFAALAMSVAVQKFAETRKKKQTTELASAKNNLRDAVAALQGSTEIDVPLITNTLWQSLVDAISVRTEGVKASESLPAETRAAVVRMAANFARADVSRSAFIADADRLAEYHEFEDSLKEQARSLHATMKLPHAGTTRRVAYSRLFVEPQFKRLEHKDQRNNPRHFNGIPDVLSSSHRTVILGDPGGGKSTLSLKLTYDIARDGFPATSARIPFLVILREYTRDFEAGRTTMLEYLETLCKSPYNLDPPSGFVDHALNSGRAFVIFDGLDELIDTSLRRKVVDLVEAFSYLYPMTPILVTTRKVGYEEAPLDSSLFSAVQLAQLNDDGVRSYADKWFGLDNTLERTRRAELSRSFYQDSRFVADLTRNPLMLSLMCGIYASENYIPANRPEVYKKCTELLFDKWDKQRGILTPLPFDAHVKHAINALAYSIYTNSSSQTGLTSDQLIEFVKSFLLAKRFEDEDEAENAATEFVDFCTGRAWVLSNVGSDDTQELYGFTHRTFLEYFAANQLVRLNPTAAQLFSRLRKKIAHAEWDVVSQLALQIIGNNTENGMDNFLERVIQESNSAPPDERANLIAFAGRSLSFAVPNPILVRSICQASVYLALGMTEGPASGQRLNYTPLRGIQALLYANSENLPSVAKNVRNSLLVAKSTESEREIALSLALCISYIIYTGFEDPSFMTRKAYAFWREFENDNFDKFADSIRILASQKAWVALQGATAGLWPIREAVDRFGPEILFQYHMGHLTLRAPFVMRLYESTGEIPMMGDKAIPDCIAELSKILPVCSMPWFKSEYNYNALGVVGDGFHTYAATLASVRPEHRDALILIAVAWTEIADDGKGVPFDVRSEGRIYRLARKWNCARTGLGSIPHALRSIRSHNLSSETVALLESWVQGEVFFREME